MGFVLNKTSFVYLYACYFGYLAVIKKQNKTEQMQRRLNNDLSVDLIIYPTRK